MDEEKQGTTYKTRYTPWGTAEGERTWVDLRPDQDTKLTRWGFDYVLLPDKDNSGATVEITIHHQRRAVAGGPWEEEPFDLRHLKAKEALRFELTSDDTLALHRVLDHLFTVREEGLPAGDREWFVHDRRLVVAKGKLAEWIVALQANHSDEEIIAAIQALEPDLLASVAAATRNAQWSAALTIFDAELKKRTWSEKDWEHFFRANDWLFGHGLAFQFMTTAVDQPHFGSADITGKGDQEGDFLLATEGALRFSVVVEIKKPQTELLGKEQYRNKAWSIGEELSGGVAQVQAQCEWWAKKASDEDNEEWRTKTGIKTVQPEGILLIGHMDQLDTPTRQNTFQRFRRNLWNPKIITYDELLDRAKFMVKRADPAAVLPADPDGVGGEGPEEPDPPPEAYDHEVWEPDEQPDWEPDPDDYEPPNFTPFSR